MDGDSCCSNTCINALVHIDIITNAVSVRHSNSDLLAFSHGTSYIDTIGFDNSLAQWRVLEHGQLV